MRESTIRWFVHVGALIMTIGIPIAVAALAIVHKIPLMKLANMNPLLIIPYAFVYFGWGYIWAIIAADWVWHGSLGIRRFVEEFVNNKKLRKIIDILILIFIIIEGFAMVYSLVAVPV
jgi:putative succinate dehydrogenase/fumarate reductase subunit D